MNDPVRVLQIVSYMNRGGTETLLMNLYRNIDRTKIQFDFLVHNLEEKYFDKEIEKLGGRIYRIPRFSPWRFDKQFKEYEKFFKAHPQYKIVHSHIDLNNLGPLRAAYKAGVPTRICHLHCTNARGRRMPLSYYCKKAVFPLVSRYLTHRFACSKLSATEGYGKKYGDAFVLNNGVNCAKFRFNNAIRDEKREEMGWNDKLVVLNVANLVEHKNHTFLVDVFCEATKLQQNVVLALAGAGPLKSQVEAKVKKLGIDDHVQFLGVRNDVPELLNAADVLLFPSLDEGFPVALVEAQVAGLPIVASSSITSETDVAGLTKFVSLEESASRWAEILLEEANRKQKSREIYAEIVERAGFDIRTSAEKLVAFYLSEYQNNLEVQGR